MVGWNATADTLYILTVHFDFNKAYRVMFYTEIGPFLGDRSDVRTVLVPLSDSIAL